MLWTGEENNGNTTISDVERTSKDEYLESHVYNFEMAVGKLKNDGKPLLDERPKANTKSIVLRLVEFNRPKWFFMLNGVLASLAFVLTQLVFTISLGKSLGFVGREDIQEAIDGITQIALVKVVQVVYVVQVIQVVQVVRVARTISLDDMHSENIWFSW